MERRWQAFGYWDLGPRLWSVENLLDGAKKYGPLYDTDLAQVWNAETGERVTVLKDVSGSVYSMDFSQDGRFLAVAETSGNVYLYDAKNYHLVTKDSV